MVRKIYNEVYVLPAYWASYLIYGDASDMSDEEQEACDKWLESLGGNRACVSVEEFGFQHRHDAFAFLPYAAECSNYLFHHYVEE